MRDLACMGMGILLTACLWGTAQAKTWRVAELRQNLFSTCFTSDVEGWAVGDLGRIFHTVDGAKTWEREDASTERPFVSIACTGAGNLWAAGQAGDISHSTDGGKTWQAQTSGTKRQLLAIAFADAQRGLAVGDFGTIVRTDDGGGHWTKVTFPRAVQLPLDVAEVVDPGDVVVYAAHFVDPQHVWLAGEFGTILVSSDGGLTWSQQKTPVQSTLFGIFLADQQNGWAVGLGPTLLHTTDGGTTWVAQTVHTPEGFSPALYNVRVRGTYGWAVGDTGYLLNSGDGGATWQQAKIPVQLASTWFRGIDLRPDGLGFIVGARGMVLATDRTSFTPLKEQF